MPSSAIARIRGGIPDVVGCMGGRPAGHSDRVVASVLEPAQAVPSGW
jgi:hypothetical protein